MLTGGGDEAAIARGIFETYRDANLRYSQMAPLTMWDEVNTKTNLPAEIKIAAVDGDAYKFLFMAKGGGSANKSYLFQETKALLNPTSLLTFLDEKLRTLGTAACPPYHLGRRHRRHVGRVRGRDGQAGLDPLPRHAADRRQRARPRLPRPRARGRGAGADPGLRHRRPVRRQVLLPRRAGHPPAPPRRLVPGRHRRVVLGRPPGAGQDHRRRRVPRAARDRPGPLPARGHRRPTCPTTSCASTSTGRWPRSAPSSPSTR